MLFRTSVYYNGAGLVAFFFLSGFHCLVTHARYWLVQECTQTYYYRHRAFVEPLGCIKYVAIRVKNPKAELFVSSFGSKL